MRDFLSVLPMSHLIAVESPFSNRVRVMCDECFANESDLRSSPHNDDIFWVVSILYYNISSDFQPSGRLPEGRLIIIDSDVVDWRNFLSVFYEALVLLVVIIKMFKNS